MPSVILRDTKLQGNITQRDSITIDGELIGDINKAEEIIVSENGKIKGNILADRNIEVLGRVVGDLTSDRIHLGSNSKIKGKLFHKSLVVDEGAQLEISASTKNKVNNSKKI